jgi:hypothetical protein
MADRILQNLNLSGNVTSFHINVSTEEGDYEIKYSKKSADPQIRQNGLLTPAILLRERFNNFINSKTVERPKALMDRRSILIYKPTVHKELLELMLSTDQKRKQEIKEYLNDFLVYRWLNRSNRYNMSIDGEDYYRIMISDSLTDSLDIFDNDDTSCGKSQKMSLSGETLKEHRIDFSDFIIDTMDGCKLKKIEKKYNISNSQDRSDRKDRQDRQENSDSQDRQDKKKDV